MLGVGCWGWDVRAWVLGVGCWGWDVSGKIIRGGVWSVGYWVCGVGGEGLRGVSFKSEGEFVEF